MLRDDFFTDPNGGYPSYPNKSTFTRYWKKVKSYEESTGKCVDDGFDKAGYIDLFNLTMLRTATDFAHMKVVLVYYISYLYNHGGVSEASVGSLKDIYFDDLTLASGEEVVVYYKNLEQLRDAIGKTVDKSNRVDDAAHDVAVSALYLAWFGVPMTESVLIKKTDVSSKGLSLNGQLLRVPDFVLKIWLRLKVSDGFNQQARNVIRRKYLPSDYLLHTEKSDVLTPVLLRAILARFNSITEQRFSLSYDVVYRSGIFNRAYRLECESANFPIRDPKFAAQVFETDIESMQDSVKKSEKIKDYEYYKQLFR